KASRVRRVWCDVFGSVDRGGVSGGAALLPGLDRGRPRRPHDHRRASPGATGRGLPGGAARAAGGGGRLLLRRRGRGRGAGGQTAAGVRAAAYRHVRSSAVRRAAGDVRRVLPRGLVVLLPLL